MAIDADQLDSDTDAELAALMGKVADAPASYDEQQDKQNEPPPAAADDDVPPPPAPEPDAQNEPPAPDDGNDWQDKYTKAEESRKNAHALMTQATQKSADLDRSNQQLQQQMATLQAQVDLLSQQSATPPASEPPADQFQELRKDYQELDPVFNKLDESAQLNQKLEQRLAAIEKARKEQEAQRAKQLFWEEVKKHHSDIDQVSGSQDFQGWFARQGNDVQELSRVSPLGAAHVMNLYKQSASQNAPNPAQKMQQAKQLSEPQVRTRSTPKTQGHQPAMTLDQIAAMPQKEFNDNEEKLDEILAQWIKQGGRL